MEVSLHEIASLYTLKLQN